MMYDCVVNNYICPEEIFKVQKTQYQNVRGGLKAHSVQVLVPGLQEVWDLFWVPENTHQF